MILCGLKGMAAYAHHASMICKHDKEIYNYEVKALAQISKKEDTNKFTELCLETDRY
ncbi:hybrid-cluster protein, putative [Trichomonas vaginalis G3]|uniref:Hybrid-cluster protein, putative n=1 Tax=Trichomonas vaginalis (strain ATCC PRA-98 / G3) TaxID=412133 RepID=A2FF43_TRIV3|nr:prismane/CO dehydrogenase family [Trichomonas vaginalis G3]EAX96456.1 hybrid-cluster protein, putative [Trichomonas vaginalis G3]KAI5503253.1 prismane/CO dehydrogenase family [Trichomonas vaginalis G3]|eukprot:XP_001309386.1 hybrid-cluster protein [Trichomonas vaginalis G3]